MNSITYDSPIGDLTLVGGAEGLRALKFGPGGRGSPDDEQVLRPAMAALDGYFAGELMAFELELDLIGTPFQRRVWAALLEIPYGQTTTYGALARELGSAEPRAVGGAVGRTPVPIIVPCHRVIGADGSLTGYGGGLDRKRALLAFEASGGQRAVLDSCWDERQLSLI
jgi:methylated-DNA-[protein]-cysteine S-methyltransferase